MGKIRKTIKTFLSKTFCTKTIGTDYEGRKFLTNLFEWITRARLKYRRIFQSSPLIRAKSLYSTKMPFAENFGIKVATSSSLFSDHLDVFIPDNFVRLG